MKRLMVSRPKWSSDEVSTAITFDDRVLGDRTSSVSFVASEALGKEVDFVLPLALLPAMAIGSDLKLAGMISSQLLAAVPKIEDVFCLWGTEYWNEKFQRILVNAKPRSANAKRASGVACFFSGGVDSFYTLLKHRDEVSHLIFVHGFDIPRTNRPIRIQASHAAREVARELGKTLIEVETDIRSFSDPLVNWRQHYQGAAMASIALLFQHLFSKVLIPSTHHYGLLVALGTHPLVDPLWSTDLTDIEHDGCEATRVKKVAYISEHEIAMRWLRVCLDNPNYAYNCGRCEKCLLTMVSLRASGSLESCRSLPDSIDLRTVADMNLNYTIGREFAGQNIRALARVGSESDLIQALEKATQPPTHYPGKSYKVTPTLARGFSKIPAIEKLARREGADIRFREIIDPAEWNTAVKTLSGNITQSWEWGLFHQHLGWKPFRLLSDGGRGAVQLLVMDLPGRGSVAYCPYGPLAAHASDLPEIMLATVRSARKLGAYLLKIEPGWSIKVDEEIFESGKHAPVNRELPDSTLIASIPRNPEVHLQSLPKDTRRRIREAHSKKFDIAVLSSASLDIVTELDDFLDLLEDRFRRQGLTVAPRNAYRWLVRDLPAHLLVARCEGVLVAGAIVATFGDTGYCFYEAANAEEGSSCAPYLVQWEAMDVARQAGCSHYDMWGIPSRQQPGCWTLESDPIKTKFGDTPKEYAEASVRVLSHLKLWGHSAIEIGTGGRTALKKLGSKIPRY